jgi:hypothetical protein
MAAPIYADRVKETTTTTGTGTLSLGGTVTGYQTFVNAIGNGNTTKILIDDGNGNWELCYSVVTSGAPATLSRGTLIGSSTGSRISFAAGTKTVAVVPAADWFTTPTQQRLTSGTGATYTTPAGARKLRIWIIGGGGGGHTRLAFLAQTAVPPRSTAYLRPVVQNRPVPTAARVEPAVLVPPHGV